MKKSLFTTLIYCSSAFLSGGQVFAESQVFDESDESGEIEPIDGENQENEPANQQESDSEDILSPYFETSTEKNKSENRDLTAQNDTEDAAPATTTPATPATPATKSSANPAAKPSKAPAAAAPTAEPEATTTTPTVEGESEAKTPPTKKVLKKKKKKAVTAGSGEAGSSVASAHGAQESGLPYKGNVDLGFNFSSQTQNLKYSDKTTKSTITELDLTIGWLFILSKMELGPLVSFNSTTNKLSDPKDGSATSKFSGFGLGAAFFFNMGNIHSDKTVPYAGTKVLLNSSTETSPGLTAEAKETIKTTDLGLQFGLKYFVGAHLALNTYLKYDLTISGEKKQSEGSSKPTVGALSGGDLNLGLGLATYF